MSNLNEQDYEGFHAVLNELIETLDARKKFHADQGYAAPESLTNLGGVLDDVLVYRDEIVPYLEEQAIAAALAEAEAQATREREAGKAVHDAFYDSLDGTYSHFDSKIEFVQNAWIEAAKALNG